MSVAKSILVLSLIFSVVACKFEATPVPSPVVVPPPPSKIPKDVDPIMDNNDKRMSWQKPFDVIRALGPLEDKTVVDLGAGIGYFAFKLLPKCKKVIAVDIDNDKIEILKGFKSSLNQELRGHLDIRLAQVDDPQLAAGEADIILIVNTVSYLSPRVEYLRNLRGHLKSGGKLFIVDYKNKRLPEFVPAPSYNERLVLYKLEEQLEAAGYKNIITDDNTLEYQYMVSAEI